MLNGEKKLSPFVCITEGVGGISVSLIMMNWRGGYSYLRSKATPRVEWTSPPFGCIRLILTVK